MVGASHLQDGTIIGLRDGVNYRIRRCEPMPKGLALYRMTPLEGDFAGHTEFALTEREIAYNAIGSSKLH